MALLSHPDSSCFPLGLWYFIVRHPSRASPAAQLSGNPIILSVREALSVYLCPVLLRPAVVWGTRCRRVGETDRESCTSETRHWVFAADKTANERQKGHLTLHIMPRSSFLTLSRLAQLLTNHILDTCPPVPSQGAKLSSEIFRFSCSRGSKGCVFLPNHIMVSREDATGGTRMENLWQAAELGLD